MIKRLLVFIVITILILAGLYKWWFDYHIPAKAETYIPEQWNNIPLGVTREEIHSQFGTPQVSGYKGDEWNIKTDGINKLFLNIGFPDTGKKISTSYRIGYAYHFLSRKENKEIYIIRIAY